MESVPHQPEITALYDPLRVAFRSQVRFKMALASAALVARLREISGVQIIWSYDRGEYSNVHEFQDKGVCWPSRENGMLVLEITDVGPASAFDGLKMRHEGSVVAHVKGLNESHGFAEIVPLTDLEPSPPTAATGVE